MDEIKEKPVPKKKETAPAAPPVPQVDLSQVMDAIKGLGSSVERLEANLDRLRRRVKARR
jgi:ubiquinone biosynthesis protein UbiJ